MKLSPYTTRIHDQVVAAAALGDDRTQQIAGSLAGTVESAVRLSIIDAASALSSEITESLYESTGGQPTPAVTVHVDGDELRPVITHPPVSATDAPPADDADASARISLRLPESLKSDIEQAAAAANVSVNTWLVRVASKAVQGNGPTSGFPFTHGFPFSGGFPFGGGFPFASPGSSGPNSGHVTGWVTG